MAKKSRKLPVASNVNVTTGAAADREFDEMQHKAKYAFEDIKRAEMHKGDKNLMKHVKKHAREEMKATKKICGE